MFDKKTSTKSTISTDSYNTQGKKKTNPYEVLFEKRQLAKSKELATHRPSTGVKLQNPAMSKGKKTKKNKAKPLPPAIATRDAVMLEQQFNLCNQIL